MKKIFTFLVLFLMSFSIVSAGTLGPGPFGAGGMFLPGWINSGGGWFHNGAYYSNDSGTIQAYTSNEFGDLMRAAQTQSVMTQVVTPVGGCTGSETTEACHPEWAESLANCVSGTFNSSLNTCTPSNQNTFRASPVVAVCSATNMTGPCRPARVNQYGANYVVSMAQQIGRAQGYNVSCTAEKVGFGGIGNDTTTNLPYYYNNLCTINGATGYGAEDLARTTNWAELFRWTGGIPGSGTGGSTGGSTGGTSGTGGVTSGGVGSGTSQTTAYSSAQYVSNLISVYTAKLNKLLADLNYLTVDSSIKTQLQTTTTQATNQTSVSTGIMPVINLTLGDGSKIGTFSAGDPIVYKVTMQDVDSVDSYYNTLPKDSCIGGSEGGEQKPWIVKAIAPFSAFNDTIESCQKGATYVISVIGTNKTSGKISASSISVYVRP